MAVSFCHFTPAIVCTFVDLLTGTFSPRLFCLPLKTLYASQIIGEGPNTPRLANGPRVFAFFFCSWPLLLPTTSHSFAMIHLMRIVPFITLAFVILPAASAAGTNVPASNGNTSTAAGQCLITLVLLSASERSLAHLDF